MDTLAACHKINYTFSTHFKDTDLIHELETFYTRAISVLNLTSHKIFLADCDSNRVHYFSQLLNLSYDTKELFEGLFEKKLHLISCQPKDRLYFINTNRPKYELYHQLLNTTCQLISLINLGIDALFQAAQYEDKLNLLLSIKDTLLYTQELLEISMLKFPRLYYPPTSKA